MNAYKKEEACYLLHDDENKQKDSTKEDSNGIKLINLTEAFYIMVGFSMGTGILIMPFMVHQLGLVVWICSLAVILTIQSVCVYLLVICTEKTSETKVYSTIRDPYQSVAENSGGYHLRRFSVVIMYVSDIGTCLSLLLVAASLLATYIPIGSLSYPNNIRTWITIIIVALTPIMYLGTYSDLKIPALVAIVTALISAIAIITNCFLRESINSKAVKPVQKYENQNFLISLATIIFVSIGPSQTICNITVLASNPTKLYRSIFSCYACMFFVYLVTGLVPYFIFDGHISSSIMTTFSDVIKLYPTEIAFKSITMVIEILMVFHLLFASLLATNPVFLHLEDALDIPRQLNWKRVAVRTSVMLVTLGICLLIPEFEFVIGISGGVPLTVLGIMLPVFMYSKLFEMSKYRRIFIYIFLVLVLLFSTGNLVASIIHLIV